MFTMPHIGLSGSSGPVLADVVWTNVAGCTVTGNDIVRTSGVYGATGGGSATKAINADGEFTFNIGAGVEYRFIGLALTDADYAFDDSEFRFRFDSSGNHSAQMKGRASTALGAYSSTYSFRLTRVSDDFQWWSNDNVGGGWVMLHQELASGITAPLYADASLWALAPASDCLDATIYGVLV